jgi:hypothetical protein
MFYSGSGETPWAEIVLDFQKGIYSSESAILS